MTSEERIRQLESENAALKNKVSDLDRKIAAKDNRIAYLEKQLYGQRTEKHLPVNPDALQLSLFHNAIDPDEQRRLDAGRRRTRRPAKGSSTSRSMTARSAR